jgi:hypothetical protein
MKRYIDENGKRRLSFSFYRLVTNAVPNFANSGGETNISPSDLDTIFEFQLVIDPPQKLVPSTIYIAGVTSDESNAKKVFEKLKTIGVVQDQAPWVDTQKITTNFTHQLAFLPSVYQKRLICLLFDWEEEIQRWKVLQGEEDEINVVMQETKTVGGQIGHLEKRLLEIKGLKSLKPSARAGQQNPQFEHPPSYVGQ